MVKSPSLVKEITLRVSESTGKDVGRGIARIDPADMQRLGVDVGDMLEVEGKRADRLPRPADLQGTPRQGASPDRRRRAGKRPRRAGRTGGGPPRFGQAGGRTGAGSAGRRPPRAAT